MNKNKNWIPACAGMTPFPLIATQSLKGGQKPPQVHSRNLRPIASGNDKKSCEKPVSLPQMGSLYEIGMALVMIVIIRGLKSGGDCSCPEG